MPTTRGKLLHTRFYPMPHLPAPPSSAGGSPNRLIGDSGALSRLLGLPHSTAVAAEVPLVRDAQFSASAPSPIPLPQYTCNRSGKSIPMFD